MTSAGLQFRTEATHKVYVGKACWCCKDYAVLFPVDEDSGAAGVEAPCAQPDPQVLDFISAADFKQGLQRANEMMQTFKKKSNDQPLWFQFFAVGALAIGVWTLLATAVDDFAGISEYPGWAKGIGWVPVMGWCVVGAAMNQKKEKIFREDVETELKGLWKNAVAQGVEVDFENEHSSSGDDNTWYPAALTITLPNGERGAVSAIEASTVDV